MFKQFGFKFLVDESYVTGEEFAQHYLRPMLPPAEVDKCMELIRYCLFCVYTEKVMPRFQDVEHHLYYVEIDDYNLRVLYSIDDEVYTLHHIEF